MTAEAENPFSQLSGIYAALDFMQIRHTEITEVETDDVIAGYAARYGKEMEILISSWDSDIFQLIGRNILVMRYKGKHSVFCDSAYVQNRYGILPSQYADFKALMGDSSDNIKGAEKVGPKTAAALLCRFGSLQSILQSADQVEKPAIRAPILQSAERLCNNYKLIRLDGSAKLPFTRDELAYRYNGLTTGTVLAGIGVR